MPLHAADPSGFGFEYEFPDHWAEAIRSTKDLVLTGVSPDDLGSVIRLAESAHIEDRRTAANLLSHAGASYETGLTRILDLFHSKRAKQRCCAVDAASGCPRDFEIALLRDALQDASKLVVLEACHNALFGKLTELVDDLSQRIEKSDAGTVREELKLARDVLRDGWSYEFDPPDCLSYWIRLNVDNQLVSSWMKIEDAKTVSIEQALRDERDRLNDEYLEHHPGLKARTAEDHFWTTRRARLHAMFRAVDDRDALTHDLERFRSSWPSG